jgi:hypothetical protein
LILAALAAALGGCGVYSTQSGRVDEGIRRVHVPYLENLTSEPTIGIDLTEDIIAALQEDNTLKVVDEVDAASDLTGKVVRYKLQEAFSSVQGSNIQVDEYQVQIMVELTFRIRENGEELFSKKRARGMGNFQLDGADGTTEETARSEAAAEIVREVLAAIVEDW